MTLWEILKALKLGCSDDLFARLTAERLNGGRMPRNTIAIQHGAGTFKATAEGKNVVWQYGSQEIHGNTCEFTIAVDSAQILVSFNGMLTKFENKSDAQTLLDLSDLGGKITYLLSLSGCKNVTGSLSDLGGKVTYYLNLYGCAKITGSLSDLGGKITYYLSLDNCQNITGSLADLGGKITYYLSLYNCSKITGSLADLGGKITHYLSLHNCKNITGAYSGNSYPTTVNLSNTGLTAEDMDQTLINFNAGTTKSGTFTANGMTRTAASDDAVAGLISRGWTVSGLTKIEG